MRNIGKIGWLAGGALTLLVSLLTAGRVEAQGAKIKMKAQLVWCTDLEKPVHDKTIKNLDAKLLEKLRNLNIFKWKNFFEVDKQTFSLKPPGSSITSLSHNCVIEARHLGENNFEVKLYGEGKLVQTIRQCLPPREYLIMAGDIKKKENEIWIVILSLEES